MARTTINLKDDLWRRLQRMADADNRSMPNLIETILTRHMEESQFVDALEMATLHVDETLQKEIKRSWADYQKGRYTIVE